MILNLILYNDSIEYNKMRNELRRYLVTKKIKYYFYCFDNKIYPDYVFDDDILRIKGNETYVPGILDKTIKAISITLNIDYKYLVRSNISTIINFDYLNNYLDNNNVQYGGYSINNLQWLDKKAGIYNHKYKNTLYVSGTAIILNKSMVTLLCNNMSEIDKTIIDDLAIGLFFKKYNIYPSIIGKLGNNISYNKDVIAYRNKTKNRFNDVKRIKQIIDNLIIN
jgi:hypothetical protein